MINTSANNKRIAKNTLLLYFRMLFLMIVSLYTSSVLLNALGVEDYGIYNVVGGVVTMFSVFSGSLSAAISRFITYEIGNEGSIYKLKLIFSSAVTIQLGLGLFIVLIAETVGVWFLNTKMSIPADRMIAANWVLQFSIITFVVNLISIPYNAAIVAHERMAAFAYISILEVFCKLLMYYLLVMSHFDSLIYYSILMCLVAFLIRIAYGSYCKRHFDECTFYFVFDRALLKEMFGFAGWNFIGTSSAVLRDQGGNILINLFCGPAVNAARAISFQVNSAIQGFVSNFMMALNPQITKSYASGDRDYMMILIFQGARLSFYMLLILSMPVLLETRYLLMLWLKMVPEYTVSFIRLTLLFTMSEVVSAPLITAMLATGKIKKYQIIVGGLQLLNLPLSYFMLHFGFFPEIVFVVAIIISQGSLIARVYILRDMIGISIRSFLKNVYLNVVIVTVVALSIPLITTVNMTESFLNFIILCLISLLCSIFSIYYIGCTKSERFFIKNKLFLLKLKLKNNVRSKR